MSGQETNLCLTHGKAGERVLAAKKKSALKSSGFMAEGRPKPEDCVAKRT